MQHTDTDITIDLTLEAWATGSPGPCPVCGIEVLEGADCPDHHYQQAAHMRDAFTISLAKAVNLISERQ